MGPGCWVRAAFFRGLSAGASGPPPVLGPDVHVWDRTAQWAASQRGEASSSLCCVAERGTEAMQLPPLFSVACRDPCAPNNPRLQPAPYSPRTARSQRIEGSLNPSPSSTEPESTGTAAQLRWGADSPSTRCTPRSAAT